MHLHSLTHPLTTRPHHAFQIADAQRLEGAVGSGSHMTVPIGMGAGHPAPLGPSLASVAQAKGGSAKDAACTINFAVGAASQAQIQPSPCHVKHVLKPISLQEWGTMCSVCMPRCFYAVSLIFIASPYHCIWPLICFVHADSTALSFIGTCMHAQVFSRNASAMSLCIMRRDGGSYLEVALDPHTNKTGDVWHCSLGGLKNVGQLCYGWRASGAISWAGGYPDNRCITQCS